MEENNDLIAEFMGLETTLVQHFANTPADIVYIYKGLKVSPKQLKYNSSWDWLIKVVDKIEEIGSYYVMGFKQYGSVEFNRNKVEIYFSPNQDYQLHLKYQSNKVDESTWRHSMYKNHIIKQFDFKKNGKFNALYSAVVEFIKWYNEQKYDR